MDILVSLMLVIAGNIIWSRAARHKGAASSTVMSWLGFGVTLQGLAGLAVAVAERLDLYGGLGIGADQPLGRFGLHALLVLLFGGVAFYMTRLLTGRGRLEATPE